VAAEFKAKDEVYVESLKKMGTVVKPARKPGVYDILVGTLTVQCAASDLTPRAALSKSVLKSFKNIAKPVAGSGKNPPSRPATLDLHGMLVEDAMRAVEHAMDRAIIEGHQKMEIVHGIGAGRIRDALHKYLAKLPIIESFRLDDQNAGVTWVYF
jgi:DNA mismatch repair protein MutS2